MEALYYVFSWGSPVGLGLFFLLTATAARILFRGISHLIESNKGSDKSS